MKRETATTLSLAAATVSLVLLMQPAAWAQAPATDPMPATQSQPADSQASPNQAPSDQASSNQAGAMETMQMVSARVSVTGALDAGKAKPGDQIRTRLARKITLKDGKVLPAGTIIVGVVAMDDMQTTGQSKLALVFNKAVLKDGTSVALKATIVGIYPGETQDMSGRPTAPGDEQTHTWTNHPDAVDEIGAMPGVDLHSKVTSQNSGVLVSTTRHDLKLKYGTEIALAVAPQQGM